MKSVPVEESLGMVLCQDITRIVPGEFKGVLFKKGHIIEKDDIEKLLDVGKEHIYVWETNSDDVHENEAAIRLAQAVSGKNIGYDTEIKEGKCSLTAQVRGMFTLDSDKLLASNSVEYVTIATLPNHYHVEKDAKIAGVRVVPLVVPATTIEEVERICVAGPILHVLPYQPLKCAIVTTGSEVYKGRIEDKFGPVMREKIAFYGGECLGQTICPDNLEMITDAILEYKKQGARLIIMTGGMSVDPDDLTPSAIRANRCGSYLLRSAGTAGKYVDAGLSFRYGFDRRARLRHVFSVLRR